MKAFMAVVMFTIIAEGVTAAAVIVLANKIKEEAE